VAVTLLRQALDAEAVPHGMSMLPMRASEDFGRFGVSGGEKVSLRVGRVSGDGGAKPYHAVAFSVLVRNEPRKAKGCFQWSFTPGFATPAMSRG
jgi:hypothetical protein